MERLNTEIETLTSMRNSDLSYRIHMECLLRDTLFCTDSSRRSFFLYIPENVCNDCLGDMYRIIVDYNKKKKLNCFVVSPMATYRENKLYFEQLGLSVKEVDLPELRGKTYKPVLFRCKNGNISNFFMVNKNDPDFLELYFKSFMD